MTSTMRMPTLELQDALLDRLEADLSVPVYDEVPERTPVDYVVIGDFSVSPDRSKQVPGVRATAIIEIWSGHRGARDVHANVNAVIQSATRKPFFPLANAFAIWDAELESFEARRGTRAQTEDPVRVGIVRIAYRIQDV